VFPLNQKYFIIPMRHEHDDEKSLPSYLAAGFCSWVCDVALAGIFLTPMTVKRMGGDLWAVQQ
jgi:hypothetical protein